MNPQLTATDYAATLLVARYTAEPAALIAARRHRLLAATPTFCQPSAALSATLAAATAANAQVPVSKHPPMQLASVAQVARHVNTKRPSPFPINLASPQEGASLFELCERATCVNQKRRQLVQWQQLATVDR